MPNHGILVGILEPVRKIRDFKKIISISVIYQLRWLDRQNSRADVSAKFRRDKTQSNFR